MKKLCLLISCFIPLLFSPLGLTDNTSEKYDAAYQVLLENGEITRCLEKGGEVEADEKFQVPICIISFSGSAIPCIDPEQCSDSFNGFTYETEHQQMLKIKERQDCRDKGGVIISAGLMGMPFCLINYDDAGKTCRASSECMGGCILVNGNEWQCKANNSHFGCFTFIEHGVTGSSLCWD